MEISALMPGQIFVYEQAEFLVGRIEQVEGEFVMQIFSILPDNLYGKPRLPIVCPSLGISIACDSGGWVRECPVKLNGTEINSKELQDVLNTADAYQHKLRSTNLVSLLMFMLHQVIPCLKDEFEATETPCKARKKAIHRLGQMTEILEFVIAVVEVKPATEWEELQHRKMPLPPPNYDFSDLRAFHGSHPLSHVVNQFTEETLLYCRCKWIRMDSRPRCDAFCERLLVVWDLTWELNDQPATILPRLPHEIRKQLCVPRTKRKK